MDRDETEFQTQQNVMLVQAEMLLQNASQYQQKDYRTVCQAITTFENHCKDKNYTRSEIDDACFFLCAFLDEQCVWEKTLLSTFYETNINKRNDFFDRLERYFSFGNFITSLLKFPLTIMINLQM